MGFPIVKDGCVDNPTFPGKGKGLKGHMGVTQITEKSKWDADGLAYGRVTGLMPGMFSQVESGAPKVN